MTSLRVETCPACQEQRVTAVHSEFSFLEDQGGDSTLGKVKRKRLERVAVEGKIAVKVINHFGEVVLPVYEAPM